LPAVIILLTLLGIAENVIRVGNAFESFRRLGAGIHVGMELSSKAAIRLFNFICGGVSAHTERFVMVSQRWLS
jgi:hypothetical protein